MVFVWFSAAATLNVFQPKIAYQLLGKSRWVAITATVTLGTNYNHNDYLEFTLPDGYEWYHDGPNGYSDYVLYNGGTDDPDGDGNVEWTIVPGQCTPQKLVFRATDDNDSSAYDTNSNWDIWYGQGPTTSLYVKVPQGATGTADLTFTSYAQEYPTGTVLESTSETIISIYNYTLTYSKLLDSDGGADDSLISDRTIDVEEERKLFVNGSANNHEARGYYTLANDLATGNLNYYFPTNIGGGATSDNAVYFPEQNPDAYFNGGNPEDTLAADGADWIAHATMNAKFYNDAQEVTTGLDEGRLQCDLTYDPSLTNFDTPVEDDDTQLTSHQIVWEITQDDWNGVTDIVPHYDTSNNYIGVRVMVDGITPLDPRTFYTDANVTFDDDDFLPINGPSGEEAMVWDINGSIFKTAFFYTGTDYIITWRFVNQSTADAPIYADVYFDVNGAASDSALNVYIGTIPAHGKLSVSHSALKAAVDATNPGFSTENRMGWAKFVVQGPRTSIHAVQLTFKEGRGWVNVPMEKWNPNDGNGYWEK